MSEVEEHYNAYPYPERDPLDEKKRLITGSPSTPIEIDHFLFQGFRDWSVPLKVLVAGGGSGDGLIQLAQLMTDAGRPYEITYLDLSTSAREIAEERAKLRNLKNIRFETDSLLNASDYGEFDYIDCCGVLHHLSVPSAGFRALHEAVSPHGGMGFMVYAPYGRSGVYPLQDAFNAVLAGLSPKVRLARAREIFEALPAGHPIKRNLQVNDHNDSDAGFYDLLLHSQDRSFAVSELIETIEEAGWSLAGFCQPGLYDLSRLLKNPVELGPVEAMEAAEKLNGTLKVHVGYLLPGKTAPELPDGRSGESIPHMVSSQTNQLANAIRSRKPFTITCSGVSTSIKLPRSAADLVVHIDGRNTMSDIAKLFSGDASEFKRVWAKIDTAFRPWGMLHYSGLHI